MANKLRALSGITIMFCLIQSGRIFAAPAEITSEQMIRLTIDHHPQTQADLERESAKKKDIDIARAKYMPKVDAMALETNGFPGSAAAVGVEGLMVSPYHKGPSAGFFVKQIIWDFGRTSGQVNVANAETQVVKTESRLSRLAIAQNAIQSLYNCSKDQTLMIDYQRLYDESKTIAKEVKTFVSSGQRSVVEGYLSDTQAQDALTHLEDAKKKFELDQREIAILIGERAAATLICPMITDQIIASSPNLKFQNESIEPPAKMLSPYVDNAQRQLDLSYAQTDLVKSDFMPQLIAIGSVGHLSNTELNIPKQNYSVAIGVIFPLFEGFKTLNQVEQANTRIRQRELNLAATQQNFDQLNIEYDRSIEAAKVRISHLSDERDLAEKAFRLAKLRYQRLQGSLVDLRETLRNLTSVYLNMREAQAIFLTQQIEKQLVNGKLPLVGGNSEPPHI